MASANSILVSPSSTLNPKISSSPSPTSASLFSSKNLPNQFLSSLKWKGVKLNHRYRSKGVTCSASSSTLPSALLFDCDGVLVDTEKDGHRISFNDTFAEKELNVVWDVDLYGELLKIGGGKERMTAYFNKSGWPDKAPKDEDERKKFIAELHKRKTELFMVLIEKKLLPLRPGVAKLVDQALAKGVKVAVCSTSNEKAVSAIVSCLLGPARAEKMDIFAGDVVPRKKPDPSIYLLAASTLGVEPSSCVVVEDSAIGLAAAKAAGMKCIVTKSGYTSEEEFTNADAIFDCIGDPPEERFDLAFCASLLEKQYISVFSPLMELGVFLITVTVTLGLISFFTTLSTFLNWIWSTFLRPPKNLKEYGSWALITGSTDGIGKALAFQLASMSINIVLVGRDRVKLEKTLTEICDEYGDNIKVKFIVIDFSKENGPEIVEKIEKGIEGLDVGLVVNNAGFGYPYAKYVHEIDFGLIDSIVKVNIEGATWVTKAILPVMLKKKKGSIVNIGSGSASASIVPSYPLYTVYAATKAYMGMFSRSISLEYKKQGIDIQLQMPLLVATKMASIKKSSFFIPSPEMYSKACVRWIGYEHTCVPYWTHAIECCILRAFPDALVNRFLLGYFLGIRKRGLAKDLRNNKSVNFS